MYTRLRRQDGDELEESQSVYTEENGLGDGSSDGNVCGERVQKDEGSEYSRYVDKSDSPNDPKSEEVMHVRKIPGKSKLSDLWAQQSLRIACKNRGTTKIVRVQRQGQDDRAS